MTLLLLRLHPALGRAAARRARRGLAGDRPVRLPRRRPARSSGSRRCSRSWTRRVIDSHAHLDACDQGAERRAGRRRATGRGRADPHGRARRAVERRGDPGRAGARGRLRRGRPAPELGRGLRRRRRRGDRGARRRARRSGRSARPGSTSTATGASEQAQVRAFEAQIGIARRTGLPLVIHVRDSSGPGVGPRRRRLLRDAGRRGGGRSR